MPPGPGAMPYQQQMPMGQPGMYQQPMGMQTGMMQQTTTTTTTQQQMAGMPGYAPPMGGMPPVE